MILGECGSLYLNKSIWKWFYIDCMGDSMFRIVSSVLSVNIVTGLALTAVQ